MQKINERKNDAQGYEEMRTIAKEEEGKNRISLLLEGVENKNKTWLHKTEIWIYDEITRYFRSAGYSWKECQRKADIIIRIGDDE